MSFITTLGQLNRRAELYHQLGSMIAAGVPLIRALEMTLTNPEAHASRKIVLGLIQHLRDGRTFHESMIKTEGWLPDFDIALLATGEQSGRLDASFKLLSKHYASRAAIIRDTITGLLTTMITLHVFLLVFPLGLLIACAQGIFNGHYSECIPFLIEKAVAFGFLYFVILFLIFACQGKRGESWRSFVETLTMPIPILGTARRYLVLSRLAAALETLINAGVSIIKSWELAGDACGSPRLKRKISQWNSQLETGATPGGLVNQTGYFPELFANLYNTGEQSGKLDESLNRLQIYYQEEGFRKLRFFTYIMNGTIYGLVVLLVAFNVIRFWMNYYANIFNGI